MVKRFLDVFQQDAVDVIHEYAITEIAKAMEALGIPSSFSALMETVIISDLPVGVALSWFNFKDAVAKVWADLHDWPQDSFVQEDGKWKN